MTSTITFQISLFKRKRDLKNFTTKNKTKKEHANDVINGVQSDVFFWRGAQQQQVGPCIENQKG